MGNKDLVLVDNLRCSLAMDPATHQKAIKELKSLVNLASVEDEELMAKAMEGGQVLWELQIAETDSSINNVLMHLG